MAWVGSKLSSLYMDVSSLTLLMLMEVSMRHISLPSSNGLMTRSGFEPNFLRVDLCFEVRLGLLTCGERLEIRFWVCLRNRVRLV